MRTKFLLFVLSLGLCACSDIVEVDLSGKRVTIISPKDNHTTPSFSQLFKWEELKGAASYQLQIVRPDFGNIQEFVLDSNVTGTQFAYTLQPGSYHWRIKAINSISASDYSTRKLTIDSTLDLSNQFILLNSPTDNFFTNSMSHSFSWQALDNTDNYLFQILSGSAVLFTQSLTGTTISYTFTTEGTYQWRVQAQNSNSSSGFSSRTITVDISGPAAPVLTLPLANDTLPNPVLLSWSSDLSSVEDSVYIYADTNLILLVSSGLSATESHSFTGTAGEDYFWRVRSRDASGNWGAYATRRKFTIGP